MNGFALFYNYRCLRITGYRCKERGGASKLGEAPGPPSGGSSAKPWLGWSPARCTPSAPTETGVPAPEMESYVTRDRLQNS